MWAARNGFLTAGNTAVEQYSVYFDGSGDYLQVTTTTALNFGSGDYTVEAWIKPQSTGSSQAMVAGSNGTFAFRLGYGYGNSLGGLQITRAQQADYAFVTFAFSQNVWYHVAVTKSSGTMRFFVDGAQKTTLSSEQQSWGTHSYVRVGQSNGDEQYKGWISNLRVIKGTALYTSSFTAPTEPLTAVSGTSLLCCHAATLIDGSSNGYAISAAGGAAVSEENPFS